MYNEDQFNNRFKQLIHDACEAEDLVHIDDLESYAAKKLINRDWVSGCSGNDVKHPMNDPES